MKAFTYISAFIHQANKCENNSSGVRQRVEKGEVEEKLFRNGNGNCTLHIQQGIFHGICFN